MSRTSRDEEERMEFLLRKVKRMGQLESLIESAAEREYRAQIRTQLNKSSRTIATLLFGGFLEVASFAARDYHLLEQFFFSKEGCNAIYYTFDTLVLSIACKAGYGILSGFYIALSTRDVFEQRIDNFLKKQDFKREAIDV